MRSKSKKHKITKNIQSEKHSIVTIDMHTQSPIQDFVCRAEHEMLFRNLWKKDQKNTN